jgi:hypothetical protein
MANVRHNKRGVKIHETKWGEPEDCAVIAKWSGRDAIILHVWRLADAPSYRTRLTQ